MWLMCVTWCIFFSPLMCRLVTQLFRSAKFGGKAHYGDTRSQKVNKCVSDGPWWSTHTFYHVQPKFSMAERNEGVFLYNYVQLWHWCRTQWKLPGGYVQDLLTLHNILGCPSVGRWVGSGSPTLNCGRQNRREKMSNNERTLKEEHILEYQVLLNSLKNR